MKPSIFLLACLIGLSSPQILTAKPVAKKSDLAAVMTAFDRACLQTAPSFANAKKVAAQYGIKELFPLGNGYLGMDKDENLSIQIKPNVECAFGSNTLGGKEVLTAFVATIAAKAQAMPQPLPTKTPFTALIDGKSYIFHLDRQGGETFVMLRQK